MLLTVVLEMSSAPRSEETMAEKLACSFVMYLFDWSTMVCCTGMLEVWQCACVEVMMMMRRKGGRTC